MGGEEGEEEKVASCNHPRGGGVERGVLGWCGQGECGEGKEAVEVGRWLGMVRWLEDEEKEVLSAISFCTLPESEGMVRGR